MLHQDGNRNLRIFGRRIGREPGMIPKLIRYIFFFHIFVLGYPYHLRRPGLTTHSQSFNAHDPTSTLFPLDHLDHTLTNQLEITRVFVQLIHQDRFELPNHLTIGIHHLLNELRQIALTAIGKHCRQLADLQRCCLIITLANGH